MVDHIKNAENHFQNVQTKESMIVKFIKGHYN